MIVNFQVVSIFIISYYISWTIKSIVYEEDTNELTLQLPQVVPMCEVDLIIYIYKFLLCLYNKYGGIVI